jgi:hypothetical protein
VLVRFYGVHRLEHGEDDLAGPDGLDDVQVLALSTGFIGRSTAGWLL